MEKLTERVDPKNDLNPKWMYCCRNCNNTEYDVNYLENKKCKICDHRYYLPTRLIDSQQSL